VALHDALHDREPNAGALELFRAMQSLKDAEQLIGVARVKAGPIVLDVVDCLIPIRGRAHLDPRLGSRVIEWCEINGRKYHVIGGKVSHAVTNPTFDPVSPAGAMASSLPFRIGSVGNASPGGNAIAMRVIGVVCGADRPAISRHAANAASAAPAASEHVAMAIVRARDGVFAAADAFAPSPSAVHFNSAARSLALCQRSSGSFARHRRTARSTAAGAIGRMPSNARFPVIISWINVELSMFNTTASLLPIPVKLFNYIQYNVDPMIAAVSAATIYVAIVVVDVVE